MKWYRSETNKKLGGVCGGIAEMFNFDVTVVRIVTFVLMFTTAPVIFIYIFAWLIIPTKSKVNDDIDAPRSHESKNN